MPSGKQSGTYGKKLPVAGITALTVAFLGVIALLSPTLVRAVWPFTPLEAAEGDVPVLHDPATELLAAALNPDPNPDKGEGDISVSESALMANSGPDGDLPRASERRASSSANSGSISVYTVKEGDSISSIADRYGVSVNTILWANDLTTKSTIRSGMDLVILPVSGIKHTVSSGETLSSIAAKRNASAGEIAAFNGLDADATVVVGSTLIIPGGEVATQQPAKAVAKATATTKKTTAAASKKVGSDLGVAAGGGYYSNPVPGALLTQGIHGNNSVDFGAPTGTPIRAAAAGTVIISKGDGAWNGGYGSYVVISHSNGTQTLYSHMSQDLVSVGDSVSQGEVIGYVGTTGSATGSHLHFEVVYPYA
jgi:LysM repeat protein